MARIVVIGSYREARQALGRGLHARGHQVSYAATAREGRRLAAAISFDLLLAVSDLPDGEVDEVTAWLAGPGAAPVPAIHLVAHRTEAEARPGCLVIAKPVTMAALESIIRDELERRAGCRPQGADVQWLGPCQGTCPT